LDYQSKDTVVNMHLKSSNKIHIEKVSLGKKTAVKPVYKLPVRMAVSLLKDEKDNIDLNIPVTGNLDDPNYKLGKIIGRVLSELVLKTAESPFWVLAKLFKGNEDDMKQFQFEYLQEKLVEKQLHRLDDVSKVLNKKKELNVEITQVFDSLEEKDELALLLAKKKYYQDTKHIVNDSLLCKRKKRKLMQAENKTATQDTLFDKYLNEKLNLKGNELIAIEDKCIRLLGDEMLNREIHKLMEKRNQQVADFLINKKLLAPERVRVSTEKDSLKMQDLTQPEFDINYSTEDK
jgi:hypothetical protein